MSDSKAQDHNYRFTCEFPGCSRSYASYNSLLFHFRLQEDHRPKTFSNKRKTTAKEAVDNLLSGIAQHTRSARVKEVVNRFSDEEVELYLLPRVAASVKASKYIQKQSENGAGNIDKARVLGILDETVKVLSNPESFVSNNVQQTVDIISLTMENVKKTHSMEPPACFYINHGRRIGFQKLSNANGVYKI